MVINWWQSLIKYVIVPYGIGEMMPQVDRRKNPEGRSYQIKALWHIHHEIIRRLLLGQRGSEIAKDLDVTPVMVSYTKNSALGKRHLSLMKGAVDKETIDVKVKIQEMAARASEVLAEAMNGDHHLSIKLKAATEVLDRAGFVKVVKTENLHAHLTADDIQQIKDRARSEGVVVEAQYETVELLEGTG